jgi:hypothetical protein
LQKTFAISSISSASGTTVRAEEGAEGIEVGRSNARSRSSPQVLQKSQPLRQEVPQW